MPPPPPAPQYQPVNQGGPTYGGFWIRFVAAFIDGIIISIPIIVLAIIVGIATGVSLGVSGNSGSANVVSAGLGGFIDLIAFVVTIGYFVYCWGTGQTIAMRLFNLHVVDATTGAPIGFGRAAVRYIGYVLSVLVCYIGLIWAAFDPRKQGWHDKIANTVVLMG